MALINNKEKIQLLIDRINSLPEPMPGAVLQEGVSVTPSKGAQIIKPDPGYDGLHDITVEAIPDKYQDVSGVTAKAVNVLDGDIFVDATGEPVRGSMPEQGAINVTIDGLTVTKCVIPSGHHNGSGTVSLTDDIEKALAAI